MALIITTINDNPATTADDSANLPPSSMYPCVGFQLDVRAPGFLTGDVTWTVKNSSDVVVPGVITAGQNTVQATFLFDDSLAPGNYTIEAEETANTSNNASHTIALLSLPAIVVSAPNQPNIGGQTQFTTGAFPFPVTWEPAEVASTGLATWTTAGTKTVKYKPTSGTCEVALTYVVYPNIVVAEYNETDCLYLNSGQTLELTVTGGSGSYTYSISGQNEVNEDGVVQAGMFSGDYTLTITDNTAGLIKTIPICIGSQTQFCVGIEAKQCDEIANTTDSCCEINIDCGESVTLKVPTFHMRINGIQQDIKYSSYGSGTIGDAGYLKSSSSITEAIGNMIDCNNDESLFEIVTSLDMADIANSPFGIGFSSNFAANGVNSIDNGVVWFTDTGVRKVQVRKNGTVVSGSTTTVSHGDVISGGYKNDKYVLYKNNLLVYEFENDCCGNQSLHVVIEHANKSLGGNLTGLTWTLTTPGLPSEVGSINSAGVYSSPAGGGVSLVEAEASVGNAKFRVNIRNVKPTLRYTKPEAFLAGKAVEIWAGPYIPGFNELIRLAKDGSPDAIQNPGMINLGVLEGSANFQEAIEYQDFDNDIGTYQTAISKESATLAATFLEVRDLHKMATLMTYGTLHAKNKGTVEFSVGGKTCSVKELRVIMVIGQPGCDSEFDILYLPRVQNKGNLGLEVGRKTNGKYELTVTALPDYTRPAGKQLYSIFQVEPCSGTVCE